MNVQEIRTKLADALEELAATATAMQVARAHAIRGAEMFEELARAARELGTNPAAYAGLAGVLRSFENDDVSRVASDCLDFARVLKP